MRASIRLSGSGVVLAASEAALAPEERPLGADASSRFVDWAASYHALIGNDDPQAGLLKLGRDIYAWLDGASGWLERLLGSFPEPPLVMEFQAAPNLDPLARAFLQVPWELLANQAGHLAADAILDYCPLRRLSPPSQTTVVPSPLVSDLRLGLMFMAAAPRGSRNSTSKPRKAPFSRPPATLVWISRWRRAAILFGWRHGSPRSSGCRCCTYPVMAGPRRGRCCCWRMRRGTSCPPRRKV